VDINRCLIILTKSLLTAASYNLQLINVLMMMLQVVKVIWQQQALLKAIKQIALQLVVVQPVVANTQHPQQVQKPATL